MSKTADPTLPGDTATEEELLEGGKVMSVMEHLDELRMRLFRSVLGVVLFFFIAFAFAEYILNFLKQPLVNTLPEGANALHVTGPLDAFMVSIKVSFLTAVIAACPLWLYQFWKFFEPALYPKERKYILPFVFASSILFFAGVAFAFFGIVPLALDFLLKMAQEFATPIITIKDYVSFIMLMIFGFGLIFETPVILILLAMLDIVDADTLAENRRFVLIAILVVGAMLTPPDPISQIAMAGPVYLMYEASIWIIRLIKRKPAAAT